MKLYDVNLLKFQFSANFETEIFFFFWAAKVFWKLDKRWNVNIIELIDLTELNLIDDLIEKKIEMQ